MTDTRAPQDGEERDCPICVGRDAHKQRYQASQDTWKHSANWTPVPASSREAAAPTPAERGEARPPDQNAAITKALLRSGIDAFKLLRELREELRSFHIDGVEAWQWIENRRLRKAIEELLDGPARAAPAAQPETTETAWQKRAETAEADLASLKATINANAYAAVVRDDELRVALAEIAKLETELVALKAERAAPAAGEAPPGQSNCTGEK